MSPSLDKLEVLLGDKIPQPYRTFLARATYDPQLEYAVDTKQYSFTIEEFFLPSCPGRDIDEVLSAVRHAIPPGSFPILSTLGGFLLIFTESHKDLNVYYWDHEQALGQHKLRKVASSAEELAEIIVEYDEDLGD